MYSYRLYGLDFTSSAPLPALVPLTTGARAPDFEILLHQRPAVASDAAERDEVLWWQSEWQDSSGRPLRTIHKLLGGSWYRIRFDHGIDAVVDRECRRVWMTWPASACEQDLGVSLWGSVFGILLRLRGTVCLHASAVRIGDAAVAFTGAQEAGKSTTAAAFSRAGHEVISEDIVTLDPKGGAYHVQPGYSHVRLCGDAAAALYGAEDSLPLIVSTWDKRRLDLTENRTMAENSAPLKAVYLLGERTRSRDGFCIQPLSLREGLMAMVANTFANNVIDAGMRRQEFDFLRSFVEAVPVRRITPIDDLYALPQLCRAVADDVAALAAARQAALP